MKTEHTPLPWRIRPVTGRPLRVSDGWEFQNFDIVGAGTDRAVATVGYCAADCNYSPTFDRAEAIENAAFIIRACNSHGDMLTALREIAGVLEADTNLRSKSHDRLALIARAAVALADGRDVKAEEDAQYRIDRSEERPRRGLSDREEYEAAHECGRMRDAEALRNGRL